MTRANWVCSADPQDCDGAFRSVRRPGDLVRAEDLGHCLTHRVQAYRMITRSQQKDLGLRRREAVDFVVRHRADARWDADEALGLHQLGDGDGALDGPVDEEDRDGVSEWVLTEPEQPSDAELIESYDAPLYRPDPALPLDLTDVDPLSALTDSRLRRAWSAELTSGLALALDAYLEDERA